VERTQLVDCLEDTADQWLWKSSLIMWGRSSSANEVEELKLARIIMTVMFHKFLTHGPTFPGLYNILPAKSRVMELSLSTPTN
jgi:hypothetical protein